VVRLELDGGRAIIAVEDRGPGVALDRLERIFDRYYTHRPSDPSRPDADGTPHFGIGLWLAKQSALSLGGQISAVNQDSGGLRIMVVLPVA
jgi:two-component system, OmpR family, sensor histidine kinase ChvG